MPIEHTLFIPIFIVAALAFCYGCHNRLKLITVGRPENRFDRPGERLSGMLSYAFGQKRVLARGYGMNHFILFWAFMLLLLANGSFVIEGLFPAATLSVLPPTLRHGLELVFDIVSLLALTSVAVAFVRRLFFPPRYLENDYTSARSGEALLILTFIAALMIAFFFLNGARVALGSEGAWQPVSAYFATLLGGLTPAAIEDVAIASWWVHAIVLLAFMNYLPRSKHMHILTAIPNCYLRNLHNPATQPREVFEKGVRFGVSEVGDLTWKDLLDTFSCTECGRCQDLCPAYNTGKPLNPRRIIHDIKVNLLKNAASLKGNGEYVSLMGEKGDGTVSEDALWSCTTCGACMEACPVMIEQVPKTIKMRRNLVEMESKFPEELLNLFENMEGRSNPWGIAPSERTKWTSTMNVKPFDSETCEYLFYVGCAGSFDSRQKHVTVAVATILDAAGVSWGILGKDEKCCGDSLRRLGNEFVFDKMAKENVKIFHERGVKKVIVQCPHCFSTLKNDYRQYGLELEVVHHSQLIEELLVKGKLKLKNQVADLGRIVFHDSCYLGRHNDVYEAPRESIRLATGGAPAEMEKNRNNAFCCGAGGGRMWMEECSGTRINHVRVEEALATKPDTVCVSCPYCMTMFEDGLKDKGAGNVRVRDVAEVVAEGLIYQE